MQITTEQGVPLVTFLLFFIVSRLFPFVTTQSSNWYGKLSLFFVYSTANFEVAQGGFPSRFLPRIFPAAPNQHRLFCDLRQEPGNTGPHLLLVICFYIHSKTACRGFKSFCPCQKRRYCFCSGAVFCHWAERLGNEARLRPAQCVSWGERAPVALCREPTEAAAETSPSAPATKPAETLGFCRFSFCMYCMAMVFTLVRTSGFLIWFYPSSTVLIPSSTRNAPGFALFWLFRVRFAVFALF